jgi:hypothetical protein
MKALTLLKGTFAVQKQVFASLLGMPKKLSLLTVRT